MNIKMYNTYFGDCFCLEETNKNVYIDFGIHDRSLNGWPGIYPQAERDIRHMQIMNDILKERNIPDFLLTHYHLDHYSGLLFMMEYMKANSITKSPIFDKFYIPDVWNCPDSSALSMIMLEDMLKNVSLSRLSRRYTLLDLVKFFTTSVRDVVFVKVGTELDFPNKCLALWPDYDNMTNSLKKMFIKFDINDERFLSDLTQISEMLRGIVLSRMEYSNSSLVDVVNMVDEFVGRNSEILLRLSETKDEDGQGSVQKYLNDFGNDISIVFQNLELRDRNYLFTGDITKTNMKKIAKNTDYPLYDKFHYVKIPHHGTDNHYFDFTGYEPKTVMIPNGYYDCPSYKISDRYVNDFKGNTRVYCSNCNWCAAKASPARTSCVCVDYNIIYPNPSIQVL